MAPWANVLTCMGLPQAGMAELADAADSKSADLRVLGVRLPLPAPFAPVATLPHRSRVSTPFRSFRACYKPLATLVGLADEGCFFIAYSRRKNSRGLTFKARARKPP